MVEICACVASRAAFASAWITAAGLFFAASVLLLASPLTFACRIRTSAWAARFSAWASNSSGVAGGGSGRWAPPTASSPNESASTHPAFFLVGNQSLGSGCRTAMRDTMPVMRTTQIERGQGDCQHQEPGNAENPCPYLLQCIPIPHTFPRCPARGSWAAFGAILGANSP